MQSRMSGRSASEDGLPDRAGGRAHGPAPGPSSSVLLLLRPGSARDAYERALNASGCDVVAESPERGATTERGSWDVVVADLADEGTLDLVERLATTCPDLAVIVLVDPHSSNARIQAACLGPIDCVEKPAREEVVVARVRQSLERRRESLESVWIRRTLAKPSGRHALIGTSAQMTTVRRLIDAYGPLNRPVLVTGESGTGKELVARALHASSAVHDGPFVPINVAAIPDSLVESELFGHRRGAFTGAHHDRHGLFEIADRGSLFLDEISELPVGLQAKLLRAVEERRICPLGSERRVRVDPRIISATNRDLEERVALGSFRRDLYFRLNVLAIEIPPLRHRPGDIPELAQHFIDRHRHDLHATVRGLTQDAIDVLVRREWPGNVRELENTVQRAMILSDAEQLSPEDLPPNGRSQTMGSSLKAQVERFEREVIEEAIAHAGGDKTRAARDLHISLATLYAKRRPRR